MQSRDGGAWDRLCWGAAMVRTAGAGGKPVDEPEAGRQRRGVAPSRREGAGAGPKKRRPADIPRHEGVTKVDFQGGIGGAGDGARWHRVRSRLAAAVAVTVVGD